MNADGSTQTFRRDLIQVLNEAGARRQGRKLLRARRGQYLQVRSARVHRSSGGVTDCDLSGMGAWGGRVRVPSLKPGDVVELSWRVDDLAQSYFGNYFGLDHVLRPARSAGCELSRLRLILPKSRRFFLHRKNGAPEATRTVHDEANELLSWEVTGLERVEVESDMPGEAEYSPVVQVSSYEDWDEFAGWWWKLIEKQFTVTEEMRTTLRGLVADAKTDLERARAVYEFVIRDIRYVAWEFGIHGYKPYKANTIFERRFGDCKDKAILISTLLRELGIKCYPVLIRSENPRSREDLTLPMVNHFNHCIAYLPPADGREGLFFDGTAEFHGFENLPASDRGASVVVVRDGKAELLRIAENDARESIISVKSEVELEEDGKGKARASVRFSGLTDSVTRARMVTEADREREIESFFAAVLGEGRVDRFEVSDLDDLTRPVEIDASLSFDAIGSRRDDRIEIGLRASGARLSRFCAKEYRVHDLLLPAGRTEKTETVFLLPEGWSVPAPPEPVDLDNELGRYHLEVRVEPGRATVIRELRLAKSRVTPQEYEAFREFCNLVDRAERESLVIVKESR